MRALPKFTSIYQKDGITELQQKRIDQLKKLEAKLRRYAEKDSLGPKATKAAKTAGRKALAMAKQLDDQGIREKDKALKKQKEMEAKQYFHICFYLLKDGSPEKQLRYFYGILGFDVF